MNRIEKPCYADYVKHALRFYSRHLDVVIFKNEVTKSNWLACHNVLRDYSRRDRDILVYVYGEFDTLADNVYTIANKYKINQHSIWDMMKEVEKKVAIERGLWV